MVGGQAALSSVFRNDLHVTIYHGGPGEDSARCGVAVLRVTTEPRS